MDEKEIKPIKKNTFPIMSPEEIEELNITEIKSDSPDKLPDVPEGKELPFD